jgi:hypothetical protein
MKCNSGRIFRSSSKMSACGGSCSIAPPINLVTPEILVELPELIDQVNAASELRVVVFESANPDYFLNHYDTSRVAETPKGLGVTGYPLTIDTSTRLSRLRLPPGPPRIGATPPLMARQYPRLCTECLKAVRFH